MEHRSETLGRVETSRCVKKEGGEEDSLRGVFVLVEDPIRCRDLESLKISGTRLSTPTRAINIPDPLRTRVETQGVWVDPDE